jgi:hypothetical protein
VHMYVHTLYIMSFLQETYSLCAISLYTVNMSAGESRYIS